MAQERAPQQTEPAQPEVSPPALSDSELSDEQLDQIAGGIIATELDNGFQAEDGRRR